MFEAQFRARDLVLLAKADVFRDATPLVLGDVACLNSGGPRSFVVDHDDASVVLAWRSEAGVLLEYWFPRSCVHRCDG